MNGRSRIQGPTLLYALQGTEVGGLCQVELPEVGRTSLGRRSTLPSPFVRP